MRTTILLLLAMFVQLPSVALAQLEVDKSVLELSNKNTRSMVRIRNSGADTLYINLQLLEVRNPEIGNENMVPLTNPATDGILVHPRQIILEPGQTRSARVVLSSPVELQERVFRLELDPLAGESLPGIETERSAGVQMLLGYKLLVLARPDELEPAVEMHRNSDSVVFQNHGNTNVLLRKLDVCANDGSNCTSLRPNRLYPNETLVLGMPSGISASTALIKTRQFVRSSEEIVDYSP